MKRPTLLVMTPEILKDFDPVQASVTPYPETLLRLRSAQSGEDYRAGRQEAIQETFNRAISMALLRDGFLVLVSVPSNDGEKLYVSPRPVLPMDTPGPWNRLEFEAMARDLQHDALSRPAEFPTLAGRAGKLWDLLRQKLAAQHGAPPAEKADAWFLEKWRQGQIKSCPYEVEGPETQITLADLMRPPAKWQERDMERIFAAMRSLRLPPMEKLVAAIVADRPGMVTSHAEMAARSAPVRRDPVRKITPNMT